MKTLIPLLILSLFLTACSQENEVLEVEEEKINEIIKEEEVILEEEFEEIIIEQEKTREELSSKQIIQNYYNYMQTGELQKAFDLRTGSNVDLETFKSWYEDLSEVNVDNFEELEKDKYSFEVEMIFDSGNISKYKVVSKVVDGKIENISSKNIEKVNKLSDTIYIKNNELYCIFNDNIGDNINFSINDDFEVIKKIDGLTIIKNNNLYTLLNTSPMYCRDIILGTTENKINDDIEILGCDGSHGEIGKCYFKDSNYIYLNLVKIKDITSESKNNENKFFKDIEGNYSYYFDKFSHIGGSFNDLYKTKSNVFNEVDTIEKFNDYGGNIFLNNISIDKIKKLPYYDFQEDKNLIEEFDGYILYEDKKSNLILNNVFNRNNMISKTSYAIFNDFLLIYPIFDGRGGDNIIKINGLFDEINSPYTHIKLHLKDKNTGGEIIIPEFE